MTLWTVLFVLTLIGSGSMLRLVNDRSDPDFRQVNDRLAAASLPRRFGFWMTIILLSPLLVVSVLAFAACYIGRCLCYEFPAAIYRITRSERIRRSYLDPTFESFNFFDLPAEVREQFDALTPELFAARFSMMGLVQRRPEPAMEIHRRWMADDGLSSAEIAWVDDGNEYIEFAIQTVLSDGTMVESSTVSSELFSCLKFPERKPGDSWFVTIHEELSVQQLVDNHEATVAEQCLQRGATRMRVALDEYAALLRCQYRIRGHWRYQRKRMNERPPEIGPIPGQAVSNESRPPT